MFDGDDLKNTPVARSMEVKRRASRRKDLQRRIEMLNDHIYVREIEHRALLVELRKLEAEFDEGV